MKCFEINGWKLLVDESLQNCLTQKEREAGCIATTLNLKYFMENKPKSNKQINSDPK